MKSFGPDKQLATAALKKMQSDIAAAKAAGKDWAGLKEVVGARKPKTFEEAAKDYMEERANFKASSISSYTTIFRSRLIPAFGKRALSEITPSELKKYQAALSKEGLSPARINTIMQLFRSVMKQAADEGVVKHDPTRSVKRVQEPKVDIDPLSPEELKLALAAIKPHFQPLFITLAYTGARPNELLALRWGDIDWVKKEISITKGRVRGKEGLPKTRSSGRVIPMPEIVEDALKSLRERPIESLTEHVFLNLRGKPIDKNLDLIWKNALRKAGLRHRPSYQLRHTFATQRIVEGFPLPYVAKLLGHTTMDTLIRHYAGWIDSATAEYNDKLRQTVGKGIEIPAVSQKVLHGSKTQKRQS
ncbi:MAG: site-specific integrase [Candidatus Obscuribacter sp.]|nr:site-specific integrase [Candidatus Obscuribacter sp.]MBK9278770.1 site-specific integrase [Candidatus Obscuribacter sp.]